MRVRKCTNTSEPTASPSRGIHGRPPRWLQVSMQSTRGACDTARPQNCAWNNHTEHHQLIMTAAHMRVCAHTHGMVVLACPLHTTQAWFVRIARPAYSAAWRTKHDVIIIPTRARRPRG
eukprot:360434-Chlamydomonas_euryale.AAC.2